MAVTSTSIEQQLQDQQRSYVRGAVGRQTGGGCRVIARTDTKVLVQILTGPEALGMFWLDTRQVPLTRSEIQRGKTIGPAPTDAVQRKAQAMLRVILGDKP